MIVFWETPNLLTAPGAVPENSIVMAGLDLP
jgi:hypothetical protein